MGRRLPGGCRDAICAFAVLVFCAVSAALVPAQAAPDVSPAIVQVALDLAGAGAMGERASERPSSPRCALRKEGWRLTAEHPVDDPLAGAALHEPEASLAGRTGHAGALYRDFALATDAGEIRLRSFASRAPPLLPA